MALRIHFTEIDLARTRVATGPDPLWEIAASLHRLQSRRGRWAYAEWFRGARVAVHEQGLERALRTTLLPLYPRAAYFPDFLTPPQTLGDLNGGLDELLATPPRRVGEEIELLDRAVGAPSWAPRLAELPEREALVRVLRAYYEAVVAPYEDRMTARIEAERTARCRGLMDGGIEGMLAGLGPTMQWRRPVLHVRYPAQERDLYLNGRGITLVPSYFCWDAPVSLADPELPPVLYYPLLHEQPVPSGALVGTLADASDRADRSLSELLGRARAAAFHATAAGATTNEIARAADVSASSASRHATALRNSGLITTTRNGATVLHTLTPLGASVLRAATGASTSRTQRAQP
ncbi:helix-turn-helix domain-containing protein [Streptomyces resistomycificus]|uniref:ArsR family transcriptional regulator n=1 Tax=Streptomyces resistomycificus TaxID=67356 RepID=A0A0L8KZS6_9ACTN|nr:helix-turn-helix domain-containing protein [Streptomyces resistomycificus]KOG31370.1 ArsR family transcriptional regulator [Streptomyces resistomycificus]KUN94277.1 ArsR family transcriptional regulator [Streptomyces resistomycificus]